MKAFKISGGIILIFIAIYLAFLFVLPNAVDLNQYSTQITKEIQKNTGYEALIEGLKVKTYWNFSIGTHVNKTDLLNANDEKFAQINNLDIKVSLIPLLMKKIRITELNADKLLANIDNKIENTSTHSHTFTPSTKLPNISIKKYRISFLDSQNKYTLKGSDLKIWDFVQNEKVKIKSIGEIVLNNRKQISYNISIMSEVLPSQNKDKTSSTELLKIFNDLYKYNTQAKINANLKINKKNNEINLNGKINLDEISMTIGEKITPKSFIHLDFMNNKAKINSTLYADEKSKAVLNGFFKSGKNKYIDIHVLSHAEIQKLLSFSKTLLKTFGKKDLTAEANGLVDANFTLKSDFKKINSTGYLKIKNANIKDNLYKVALNSLNADVDFSQNYIDIRRANAALNGQPITIKGSIDEKANANIQILANDLQLKSILFTTGNTKFLQENDISGLVRITALIKGRLDKISTQINGFISNINLTNKKSNTKIKIAKIIINTNAKAQGKTELTDLKIYPQAPVVISAPKVTLDMEDKEAGIEKTYLYINKIKTTLSGKISNVNSSPKLNNVTISIPNQISVPIEDYPNSNIILSGNMAFNGNPQSPDVKGFFDIPFIKIPTSSTLIKNSTLQFDKEIRLNCPSIQIADSQMKLKALFNTDFTKGIIAKNVDFAAQTFNLNSIIPIFKALPKKQNYNFTILSGKSTIGSFKVGNITSNNINSNISMKNNVLYLKDLTGEAYNGKIAGDIDYDLTHRRLGLDLQGRGLSANPAITAITRRNDDINGILDFDGNISMTGFSKYELLNSLKGDIKFLISNGKMGVLGKFEHLLYAQNVISSNIFKASLNLVARAVTAKNTGVYKYMKGRINFANSWANIDFVKTSGPSMSLYMTGRYNLLYNTANLIILGRISDDVVRILGPIGEFSVSKAVSAIPGVGEVSESMANQLITNPNYENKSQIPDLTPKTEFKTKEFKVIINGEIQKQSSVKSFKWLATPKIIQPQIEPIKTQPKADVPDFVKNLPDMKQ